MTNLDMVGLASRPIPGVHEFIAAMMVFTVFLAVSLAQARRAHIQVDLFTRMMPTLAQKALALLQHALGAIVFGLIAWFGWKMAWHAVVVGEFSAGLYDFPLWPARTALALGATLVAVQCLFDLLAVARPRWRTADDDASDAPVSH
jgi:TRAP-type C4-dicarboxylate transport system permease small subunit